jgi:Tol biopolymer transport system component
MISSYTKSFVAAVSALFMNAVPALSIEPVKLLPSVPTSVTPVVWGITGDSRYAVVSADLATEGGRELYSTRAGGGGPLLKLSQSVGTDRRGVEGVVLAPLGDTIVFVLDATTLNQRELFAVKADGSSAPVKLAGPTAAGGTNSFKNVTFSPDGTRIVFVSDLTTAAEDQLWSVKIDGTALTSLSPVPRLHGAIGTMSFSADSTRLAYSAKRLDSANLHVWTTSLSGGPLTYLSGTGDSSGNASESAVSPDGQTIAFGAYTPDGSIRKIWSVPALGGQPVLLSPDSLGNTYHSLCGFTANSSRVLFTGGGSAMFPTIAAQLYSSTRTGLDATTLFTPSTSGGGSTCPDVFDGYTERSAPYNDLAIEFRGCSGNRCDIYSVAPTGGQLTNLTSSLPSEWSVAVTRGRPVGDKLIFSAFNSSTGEIAFWMIDRTSGIVQKISNATNPFGSGDILRFAARDAAGRIIFYSNHADTSRKDLWVVDALSSSARLLTGKLPPGATGVPGAVVASYVFPDYKASPNGKTVLFRADRETPGTFTWWSAPLSRYLLNLDDVDTPTIHNASTDGVTLLRYLFGFRGDALIGGNSHSVRASSEISALLEANKTLLDVDGDGGVYALSDGIMIVRRMLGLPDAAVTSGAKATNRTDAEVVAAIDLMLQ